MVCANHTLLLPPRHRGPARAEGEHAVSAARKPPAYLMLVLILVVGCTTSRTALADPDRSPATKADMKNYVLDSYNCVRQSEQDIRLGQLPWSRERDAQRLYESCMASRGYDVQRQDATR